MLGLNISPLALSVAMLATSFAPAEAFIAPRPNQIAQLGQGVDVVQYRRLDGDDLRRRHGYYRRGNETYYNGHRGYYERRRGYRRYNGAWFPLGAFAAGAIIGGAVADRPVRYGGSHVEWCANRYRSYRTYDNTYQPYNGPRRQCNSPY
ncbi:BA14K family protein [Pararhizobium sp. DWP3-4]|uniref:BA14K family protein n=1 Tax=unclassified Pararhizobium TaxID=2643050 RepID=UPI003CEBB2C9